MAPPSRTSRSSPRTSSAIGASPWPPSPRPRLEAAEAALAAIEAVYEPLPPVFDLATALAPGAPLVHEGWQSYVAIPILQRDGNVCNRARIVVGDVERGLAEADRIFEHRFTTAMVHQGYTEPRAAVASWDSAGQVTVWSNTQLPFDVQSTLAEILAIAPSKIRVIVPGVGGGFGGKLRVGVEHFAALLARKSGPARQDHDDQRGGADRGVSAPGRR